MRIWLLGLLPLSSALNLQRTHEDSHERPLQLEGFEKIPKIIHFMFKTDLRGGNWTNYIWEKSFGAWQKYFPEGEYQYMWWTDEMLDTQFQNRCSDHYQWYKSVAFSPDLARACVLKEHGGIYSDLDYEPRQNFYEDLMPGKINLLESWKIGQDWVNVLMASPPESAVGDVGRYWDGVLALSETRALALHHRMKSAFITGPWLLDHLNETKDADLVSKLPSLVHTLPCREFYRQGWQVGAGRPKPGCGGLSRVTLKQVKGVHWSTVSWYRKGSGANIDERHNRRAITRIERDEISDEIMRTRFRWPWPANRTNASNHSNESISGQARGFGLARVDNADDVDEDVEISEAMQKLFDEIHG